jgi:4-hydroxy-3-methylbut-2-enyl diphosphate reductase
VNSQEHSSIFYDAEVAAAQASVGGVPVGGGLRLHLPRTFGFCGGVLKALQRLQKTIDQAEGRPIWLLGEIIHNDTVNRYFREQDVKILPEGSIEEIFAKAAPEDIVVIPAFGIPRQLEARLREFVAVPENLVDTACGYVRRIWSFVEQVACEGVTVVIHGKPNHPETRATLSRALTRQNAVVILPDLERARQLAETMRTGRCQDLPPELLFNQDCLDLRNLAVVNQTTMLHSETREIEAILSAAAASTGGRVQCCNTVCRATQERQDAAQELCRQNCDVILVVGGFASSNTNQLQRLACLHAPTYFIRDADSIQGQRIIHYLPEQGREIVTVDWLPEGAQSLCLLAGASCPPSDIGAVIRKLRAQF